MIDGSLAPIDAARPRALFRSRSPARRRAQKEDGRRG